VQNQSGWRSCDQRCEPPQVLSDCRQNEIILGASRPRGRGQHRRHRDIEAGGCEFENLVLVKFPLLRRRFFAIRHKERYVSRAEQAFLDVISNNAAPNRQKRKGSARVTLTAARELE
jgi:hypothetical protein